MQLLSLSRGSNFRHKAIKVTRFHRLTMFNHLVTDVKKTGWLFRLLEQVDARWRASASQSWRRSLSFYVRRAFRCWLSAVVMQHTGTLCIFNHSTFCPQSDIGWNVSVDPASGKLVGHLARAAPTQNDMCGEADDNQCDASDSRRRQTSGAIQHHTRLVADGEIFAAIRNAFVRLQLGRFRCDYPLINGILQSVDNLKTTTKDTLVMGINIILFWNRMINICVTAAKQHKLRERWTSR